MNILDKSDFIQLIAQKKSNIHSPKDEYLPPKHHGNQKLSLTTKILSTSINYNFSIHPRIFCRRWFGLLDIDENNRSHFTENQILEMESEYGYREKCIHLISRILMIKPNTIHRWGKGVLFDKIPINKRNKYEIYLGYVDSIRVITMSLGELNETSLLRLIKRLETNNAPIQSFVTENTYDKENCY